MSGRMSHAQAPRRGFTLVELLVVIIIISVLAALAVPAVMRTITSARNAAIKSEIDLLHMAIMNYKNEYGSFPPCFNTIAGSSGAVVKHLNKLFPRISYPPSNSQIAAVNPATALVIWLSGYTTDPTDPVAVNNTSLQRKKLFDFDQSRITGFQYAPPTKPGSPYIYINSATYAAPPAGYVVEAAGGAFFNADTFQILSAGRDEIYGNDDDLSNFWPGTRKDYLDSLSN